LDNLGKEKSGC